MSASADRHAVTPERRGMLAKVHLARKQLAMSEDAYRDLVRRMTGNDSARLASDAQLHKLLGEFGRLGFRAGPPQTTRARPHRNEGRLIVQLWAELAPFLRDHSGEVLRSFVRRQTRSKLHPDGVAAVEFLDSRQASRVIEGLKAWLAREKRKAAAPAGVA